MDEVVSATVSIPGLSSSSRIVSSLLDCVDFSLWADKSWSTFASFLYVDAGSATLDIILRYSLFSKVSSVLFSWLDTDETPGTLERLPCNFFPYEFPSSFDTDVTPGTLESFCCNFSLYEYPSSFDTDATSGMLESFPSCLFFTDAT